MKHCLYSFRRCPYAMRARLAIAYSGQSVQLREIILKEKPAEMLALSSKGTVPVLALQSDEVLDESLDIMGWALSLNDPDQWLSGNIHAMLALIDENDFEFKGWLDRYKYADRFPEYEESYYREQCEDFLIQLEQRLANSDYLFSEKLSLADIAIFPFIRQFAAVDQTWFQQAPYPHLQKWLDSLINASLFKSIMQKYPTWLTSQTEHTFP
ncbi:glutathione S-transferase [Psychromonas sp. Urea-02u-13]|uniref:glutathione S-transferase n=1 Tax=Psychromonas sp. Urea-02u-13 TaxID=2058326 RepID=UPI000C331FD5|nr:glutathione S-transferase [Psychromonas sp. Urea-02u-13]PKG38366.1 glutathione S-transferase [Psychromonas sp. Urea-02u-13]